MGGDWSTGIFGCFSDPGTFCMAMCGWPFLVGRFPINTARIKTKLKQALNNFPGKNAEAIGEDGTLWALSAWSCCTNSLLRSNIRKKQGWQN